MFLYGFYLSIDRNSSLFMIRFAPTSVIKWWFEGYETISYEWIMIIQVIWFYILKNKGGH